MFWVLNDRDLRVEVDDAVTEMLGVAAGEVDEAGMAIWLSQRVT